MTSNKESIKNRNLIKALNTKTKYYISKHVQALGYTRQTIKKRLEELEEKKIITNFTVNIHPNLFPNGLKFIFLEIKTNPTEPELVKELLKIPQMKSLDGIIGEFSLFAQFLFNSNNEYYQILNKIDNIMAQSYFKKYQIIETIRVFKINGINLSEINLKQDFQLDEYDYLIINILKEEQGLKPISTYDIRNLIKKKNDKEISQPTIHNRIKKLEQSNVIVNYAMNFIPKKIGYNGKYILRIKPKDPSKYNDLALRLEKNYNITDLFRIGEQYGLLALVRVKKVKHYSDFIKNLYETEEIEDTYTNFVLDELISYTNFVIS